jgi:hypothetical protein
MPPDGPLDDRLEADLAFASSSTETACGRFAPPAGTP